MLFLAQILHILYFTGRQIGDEGLSSIILAGHGLLVKILIILDLHIYFDQILHTDTQHFNIVRDTGMPKGD